MKNQYFADRRDFFKYELLLDLARQGTSPGRLLSLLMLTPDDQSAEGNVKTYNCGLRRPGLHDFLRGCLKANSRAVRNLRDFMRQIGLDYVPHRDDEQFHVVDRNAYFAVGAELAREHSLLFFDPDIGLETGSESNMRRNGMEKYLMYSEVSTVSKGAAPNAVIVVYQHLQKNKHRVLNDIDVKCRCLCRAVGSHRAAYVTDRDVAFLVTTRHGASAKRVVTEVLSHGKKHDLEAGEVAV